jgi:hypothetical protein
MVNFPAVGASGFTNNATAYAFIGSAAGKTTYLTTLAIAPGTLPSQGAPSGVVATLTGTMAGTISYPFTVPSVDAAMGDPDYGALLVNFSPPLVGVAGGTIVLTIPPAGAGGLNLNAVLVAYQV